MLTCAARTTTTAKNGMRPSDDGYALMIAAADDAQDVDPKSYEVTFRAYDRIVTVYRGNTAEVLLPDADGVYHVPMTSCAGALVTAK